MSKQEGSLPLAVMNDDPRAESDDPDALVSWYRDHQARMEELLLVHGALLFRGFGIHSQDALQRVVSGIGGAALDYVDGNSPRRKLSSAVYTSTEYPPEFFISLHNELSYSSRWPTRLFFCCVIAPAEGGETPLADSRAILGRLSPEVRDAFVEKGVKYVRNLHGGSGFGPSWQKTFETEERGSVEDFFRGTGTGIRWNDDGSLTVTQVRPAIATHPTTGETVWFNQADQFHPSTHPKAIYDSIKALYEGREDMIPQTAFFGDGTPIDPSMLDEVRRTVNEQIHLFSWQRGDLLLVDNMLVAHGRNPFKPPRKILVSMTG
jgi:alpha-ketoglutarate-dependent taurine dioxygenase